MKNNNSQSNTTYMPIFMCIGIGVGMAIGLGFVLFFGGIIDYVNRKKHNTNNNNESNSKE